MAAETEALTILRQKGVDVSACNTDAFRARVLPQTDSFIAGLPESKPIVDLIRSTAA